MATYVPQQSDRHEHLWRVIFLSGTRAGRMFRVLKMPEHLGETKVLLNALNSSRRKVMMFFIAALTLVLVEVTTMYVIERDANPSFANIPQAIYWAGLAIIRHRHLRARPGDAESRQPARRCKKYGWEENDLRARFCQQYGTKLE